MQTRTLVDPELVPFLDSLPSFDFSPETLPEIRRVANETPPLHAPEVQGVRRDEVHVPGPEGEPPVRVVVHRPETTVGERLPAVLHVHGGGFVMWGPEISDLRNRFIAGDLRCVVVSVDYRHPPETPFPGPIEDCYAALRWLHDTADTLGVDPARIAVQGESAGGGLAAALVLLARDRKEVPVAFQVLVYPMLDDRTGTDADPHPNAFTGEFVWTRANNRFAWRAMLDREPGEGDVSPYCAPARAADLTGLPPTFIQVGSLDLFLDEDLVYAQRLTRAGIPTEIQAIAGAFHGFDMMPGTRIGARFATAAHEALRRGLGF
ncbi:alpha/beta hydrolase [Nannocystis sp. ILAH1]|uniref:alpha/beta hydrolase n=1 Tax=unclassified Nannocystis TaxID=2627009 RepID=UPI00226E442A|nr:MULTISPECIES: alpha/beta hydrolase [unclassified Nannocystis]MCY0986617.1 alpha/beta hydrolase [Nannocystis sp. ILAH1]MCY1071498.1 alpha/beta hydrolase [Nannocystis sp. RBIL2]